MHAPRRITSTRWSVAGLATGRRASSCRRSTGCALVTRSARRATRRGGSELGLRASACARLHGARRDEAPPRAQRERRQGDAQRGGAPVLRLRGAVPRDGSVLGHLGAQAGGRHLGSRCARGSTRSNPGASPSSRAWMPYAMSASRRGAAAARQVPPREPAERTAPAGHCAQATAGAGPSTSTRALRRAASRCAAAARACARSTRAARRRRRGGSRRDR